MGVNKFITEDVPYQNIQKIDHEAVLKQIEKLKTFKNNRDEQNVQSILTKLVNAAKTNKNLIPIIVEAAKAHATLGEISYRLRTVFDEYKG